MYLEKKLIYNGSSASTDIKNIKEKKDILINTGDMLYPFEGTTLRTPYVGEHTELLNFCNAPYEYSVALSSKVSRINKIYIPYKVILRYSSGNSIIFLTNIAYQVKNTIGATDSGFSIYMSGYEDNKDVILNPGVYFIYLHSVYNNEEEQLIIHPYNSREISIGGTDLLCTPSIPEAGEVNHIKIFSDYSLTRIFATAGVEDENNTFLLQEMGAFIVPVFNYRNGKWKIPTQKDLVEALKAKRLGDEDNCATMYKGFLKIDNTNKEAILSSVRFSPSGILKEEYEYWLNSRASTYSKTRALCNNNLNLILEEIV